ncbi:glycosyltransferase [Pedobacter glucosidilyticus]|uniref:glycosyltransferase n=1 Tax=Pedobacter glucosidilyticus TaxID=1122941 RepID=UPI000424DDDB|nr:glycosyltransferase [Pedobacter glucosidilyticus]
MNKIKLKNSLANIINVAILSTNNTAYSETFIKAHKTLPFHIKFYYGGTLPSHLEGEGYLVKNRITNLINRLKYVFDKSLSTPELALKHSLAKNRIQLVLAEFGVTAADSLNVIKSLNIPLITHFHGADASEYKLLNAYRDKYLEVFSYAKKIVVVSRKMKSALIELGCPEDKLLLNTYGPHSSFFEIPKRLKKQQFVAIGRFVDKKAPYLLIMAFQKIVNKHPNTRLVFGGDGPLLNTCKNLVKIMGLQDNVSFLGVLKPHEVKALFTESIAFVQHSIVADNGDSEGTPVSILEAQAAALPVISTYHAGIPDVVIHKKTGLLCEEMDIEKMANNMLKLIENPELCRLYGKNAAIHIKENFSIEKHLSCLEEAIKKTIDE